MIPQFQVLIAAVSLLPFQQPRRDQAPEYTHTAPMATASTAAAQTRKVYAAQVPLRPAFTASVRKGMEFSGIRMASSMPVYTVSRGKIQPTESSVLSTTPVS